MGTKTMTIDEMREALSDRKIRVVSEETGVKYHTVLNIANGKHKNPTYENYKALLDYLSN